GRASDVRRLGERSHRKATWGQVSKSAVNQSVDAVQLGSVVMKTSDWALIISLCSFAVALSSFVWNVWSKFIYPKPAVRVTLQAKMIFQPGSPDHGHEIITLTATNFGPGDVTLHSVIFRHYRAGWWKNWRAYFSKHYRRQYGLLNPLEGFPARLNHTIGP